MFKVGDRVKSKRYGIGMVVKNNFHPTYPFEVIFENSDFEWHYTNDGWLYQNDVDGDNDRIELIEEVKPQSTLVDSGVRIVSPTGGLREPKEEYFHLIPMDPMMRLAKHYYNGSIKYGKRNWQKGVYWSTCIDAIFRHVFKFKEGHNEEDHLAAACWNIVALMEYQTTHPELNDLYAVKVEPKYHSAADCDHTCCGCVHEYEDAECCELCSTDNRCYYQPEEN